jgi:hypothetical protein
MYHARHGLVTIKRMLILYSLANRLSSRRLSKAEENDSGTGSKALLPVFGDWPDLLNNTYRFFSGLPFFDWRQVFFVKNQEAAISLTYDPDLD